MTIFNSSVHGSRRKRSRAVAKVKFESSSKTRHFCLYLKIALVQIHFPLTFYPHSTDDQIDSSVRKMKNTDKSLYLSSQRAKKCPLCQKVYKRMVSHFRRNHSNHEVFVSRVSPNMAESLLQAQSPAPIKYMNASGMQYLKMVCPFCDVVKDFFAPYWGSHMRTHTGEYVNKCEQCKTRTMSTTHCGWPTSKPKCNLYAMGLTAYICIRCNYMQIDKKNIVAHLKRQHNRDRVAITSMENEYRMVVLMPPLKEIRVQANPNVDVAQGEFIRFDVE